MILKLDLTDSQLAGLAAFLASSGNDLLAPKGFNFLKEGNNCGRPFWIADWRSPRPKLAKLVRSERKNGKNAVVVEVLEWVLVGQTNETINDIQREAAVHFVPADILAPLFESVSRFPTEPRRADCSPQHLWAIL